MIEGNVLKFGYGDIAVSSGFGTTICYIPFKPPIEVGTDTRPLFANGDIKPIGNKVDITFDCLDDLEEFKNKLGSVCYTNANKTFNFKGYVFDFTNYNEESINVVKKAYNIARNNYIRLSAC